MISRRCVLARLQKLPIGCERFQSSAAPRAPATQLRQISTETSTPANQQPVHPQTQSYHHRKHGNRALPLSSFLDPLRIAQRQHHRNRAPKPAAPAHADLDPFRQQLASNAYAHLLAQPVRPCALTGASLPQPLLLNFTELADPEPPHARTLVPLRLHNRAARRAAERITCGGVAGRTTVSKWIALKQRFVQWLADVCEAQETLRHAIAKYDGRMLPNTLATVNELLAESVITSLRWPLARSSKDFVPLPAGLPDLSTCDDPAIVLYFGGRVHTKRIAAIEPRIDALLYEIDTMLQKAQSSFGTSSEAAVLKQLIPRADPRALHAPVDPSAVRHCRTTVDGVQHQYSVPVIPMVDLLDEDGARRLLEGTNHADVDFIAVKSSQTAVRHVTLLLACAVWMKDGIIEKTRLPKQD